MNGIWIWMLASEGIVSKDTWLTPSVLVKSEEEPANTLTICIEISGQWILPISNWVAIVIVSTPSVTKLIKSPPRVGSGSEGGMREAKSQLVNLTLMSAVAALLVKCDGVAP